jgi:iron complex transport system substrate-binding protein
MVAVLCFALALCSPSWAGSIVDSTGSTVESTNPQRIITIAGNVSESVFALGLGDQVVAVDASSLYPEATEALPKVGYYRNINAEGVLSLSPDLILTTDAAGPPPVLEQLRGSGIPIAVLSGAQTMQAAQDRITAIGTLLDRPDEAKVITDRMAAQLAAVVKPETAPKVLFVYARGAGTLNVAGTDTSADAMIRLAGGANAVQGYEGYKPMSAEAIIEAAPDVILFTTRGLESIGGTEGAAKLIGIEQTPAGQRRKIIAIDDLVLLGFGPRTGEGVQELSKKLQP